MTANRGKPSRAMLAAIGEVAAESAIVDDKLRDVFGLLMESPYAQVIAAGEDTSRLLENCTRVAAYNERITDDALKQLQGIYKAVNAIRPYRNVLVHSVWHKIAGSKEHVGIRSRRPSNATDTTEVQRWTPAVAIEIAEHYRTVGAGIDQFIESAFDRRPYPPMMSRKRNAEVTAWFEKTFSGFGLQE